MSEEQGRGSRRAERPSAHAFEDLKEKRDAFLHSFFKRGAELTEELVGENQRLRDQIARLEEENGAVKTQLASDTAIRDLLLKIGDLESEKARLLSTVREHTQISGRFAELESELESFANLYVASFQLHSSLRVPGVIRHIRELLVQLVGVRSLGVYFLDEAEGRLVPFAADGVEVDALPVVSLRDALPHGPAEALLERAVLTGVPHIETGEVRTSPAACIPLHIETQVVGAIVVYSLLDHKKGFIAVDLELLKLLGAHAGGALVSAYLWGQSNRRLPHAQTLREMDS